MKIGMPRLPVIGLVLYGLTAVFTLQADSQPTLAETAAANIDYYYSSATPEKPGDIDEALRLSSTELCH
ncbi:hypothetical protein CY652_20190 [Burkholderia sp. WAC0059]|nr:hypothetical protein CY652_20190 [Burkholderia sp. WAC0059]